MSDSNNRIDLVSGAEVPAEEIAVTQAMIEAGIYEKDRGNGLAGIYRAMERARCAEPRRPTIEELEVFLCPTGQRFSVYIKPWPGNWSDGDGNHG